MRKNLEKVEKAAGVKFHTIYSKFGNLIGSGFWVVGKDTDGGVVVYTKQEQGTQRPNTLYSAKYGLESAISISKREITSTVVGTRRRIIDNSGDVIYRDIATNKVDREDGSAVVKTAEGVVYEKQWMRLGLYHRLDGPAFVVFYPSGQKAEEHYYINGIQTRTDGPAMTKYWNNGQIQAKQYYLDGKLSCVDGPALIWYDENGHCLTKNYFINDKQISKAEFDRYFEGVPLDQREDFVNMMEGFD